MIPLIKATGTTDASEDLDVKNVEGQFLSTGHLPEKLYAHDYSQEQEYDAIAFILAGGKGERLRPLTEHCCKPAIAFGGSCRIIDFTVANCMNSGISRIFVLTQYRQDALIEHLHQSWHDNDNGYPQSIKPLPANLDIHPSGYQGTADAIAKNIAVLKNTSARNTLILAGDHVYKADYRRMLRHHLQTEADVTVACCEVDAASARRFGVVEVSSNGKITGFEEKPQHPARLQDRPDHALASMGIYIFRTQKLIEILQDRRFSQLPSLDFGRDIFPDLIQRLYVSAYAFDRAQNESYWQDIGTIDSYYNANMQLLQSTPALNVDDRHWPICVQTKTALPARLCVDSKGYSGSVSDCIIGSGCITQGARIRHSVIFQNVRIGEKSLIDNSLVLPGATLGRKCKVRKAIIDSGVILPDGTEIGYHPNEDGLYHHISPNGITVVGNSRSFQATLLAHRNSTARQGKTKNLQGEQAKVNQVVKPL
ncbi:MAG: glucose-1-phosphate adenylyltransferase [Granulosicoccus sp.]